MRYDRRRWVRLGGAGAILLSLGLLSCKDAVMEPLTVAAVEVSGGGVSLRLGQTTQLTPTLRSANGFVLPNVGISWSSSDSTKALVSNLGLVTAKAAGIVTISATIGGKTGSAQLNILTDKSLSFTPGNYVRIPKNQKLQNLRSMTVEFFAFFSSIEDEAVIGTEYFGTGWHFYPGTWAYFQGTQGSVENSGAHGRGASLLSSDRWYHVAMVYDGTATLNQFKLFLNGVLIEQKTAVVGIIGDNLDVVINRHTWDSGSSSRLTGKIDEVRISNIARYSANFGIPVVAFSSDSNTLALYHFEEGSGTKIVDSSGNGIDGYIVGAMSWSSDSPVTSSSELTAVNSSRAKRFNEGSGASTSSSGGTSLPLSWWSWTSRPASHLPQ